MKPVGWRDHPHEHAMAARGIKTARPRLRAQLEANGVVKDIVEFPEAGIDYNDLEEVFALFWVSSPNHDFSNFDFDEAFDQAEELFRRKLAEHGGLGWEAYLEQLEEIYGEDMTITDFTIDTDLTRLTKEDLLSEVGKEIKEDYDYRASVEESVFSEFESMDEDELEQAYEDEGFVVPKEGVDYEDLANRVFEERWDNDYYLDDYICMRFEDILSYSDKVALAKTASRSMWERWGSTSEYDDLNDAYEKLLSRPRDLQGKIVLMDQIIDARHVTAGMWDDDISDVDALRNEVEQAWKRYGRSAHA